MPDLVTVPYFDGAVLEHDTANDDIADPACAKAALAAFLRLGPADRLADSRHLWAYYRDVHQTVGGTDWLDAQMGVPAGPAGIWDHVKPRRLHVSSGYGGDGAAYIVVSGACDWEDEHGLMLVWQDGQRLTKAGGFDGHVSNVDAYDDPAYAGVVHASSTPEFVTRLDGE